MNEPRQSPETTPRPAEKPARLAWMPAFLRALAETRIVRQSVKKAGIALPTAYDARARHPEFARAWDAILEADDDPRGKRIAALCLPAAPSAGEAPAAAGKPASNWRSHFFDALAETSNVSVAVVRAKVTARTVYKLRREDAAFAARWLAALHEGYDNLEMELLGYLRAARPQRKMDVAAALRLLAAHRDTVERRRALTAEEDEQAVLESIDRFIDEMRVRRDANNAILVEAGAGDGAE